MRRKAAKAGAGLLRSQCSGKDPCLGLVQTPQAGVQQPDYSSLVEQNYKAQASPKAAMGGLFGLGGTLLEGIPKLISSDRNDKADIEKLGRDEPTGIDMYAYRYKDDPKTYPKVVGPMAQDVERKAAWRYAAWRYWIVAP